MNSLNPYSNGIQYLINNNYNNKKNGKSLNPYSNGIQYLIIKRLNDAETGEVS